MKKSIQEIIEIIKSKNKTLFILCGLPYSGKTYLAEEIIKSVPITHISIDDILYLRGYDWNSNTLPDESEWAEIFETSYYKSKEALNNSLNVLYDSTNHTKTSRDALRKMAESVGAETYVIFMEVPLSTVYSRWEENRSSQIRPIVDMKLIEMTIEAFERPTEDEHVLIPIIPS